MTFQARSRSIRLHQCRAHITYNSVDSSATCPTWTHLSRQSEWQRLRHSTSFINFIRNTSILVSTLLSSFERLGHHKLHTQASCLNAEAKRDWTLLCRLYHPRQVRRIPREEKTRSRISTKFDGGGEHEIEWVAHKVRKHWWWMVIQWSHLFRKYTAVHNCQLREWMLQQQG